MSNENTAAEHKILLDEEKKADEYETNQKKKKKKSRHSNKGKILKEQTIKGIAEYIMEYSCENILVLSGAGVSTNSGLPDMRTPPFGLYYCLKAESQFPYVHAIFENKFFKKDPKSLYTLLKRYMFHDYKPSKSHYFVALLEKKKVLLKNYTLNIDGLERLAGVSEDKLGAINGDLNRFSCIRCRRDHDAKSIRNELLTVDVPYCPCGGVVKPRIYLYGEALPKKFCNDMADDFKKCDVLIVLGTSLCDQPVASMPFLVPEGCPRLVVNASELSRSLDFDFSNMISMDVLRLGDCEEACMELVKYLGWTNDLNELVNDLLNMNV